MGAALGRPHGKTNRPAARAGRTLRNMHTHYYLASIAQLEFDALVQDTERAIKGLNNQRESVMQAIEAIQELDQNPNTAIDEMKGVITRLLDKLGRLNSALDQVMREIEES